MTENDALALSAKTDVHRGLFVFADGANGNDANDTNTYQESQYDVPRNSQ